MARGNLWIVLTKDSREKLLAFIPPFYPHIFADHVTLFYNVELIEEYKSLLGAKVEIILKENIFNHKIQATTLDIGELPCQNTSPHITISAQEGIKPFESNSMLESDHTSVPVEKTIIEGIVEFKEF